MKNLIILVFITLALIVFGGCLKKNKIQFDEEQLTVFLEKADLRAEQVFENLVQRNRTEETISVFARCDTLSVDNLKKLEDLGLKVQKMGEDMLTLRGPARLLPSVATFDFVKAIEGAREVKLRRK